MSARRELLCLIESLDGKLVRAGLPPNESPETRAALVAELAADATGFAVIDDYEARLGLDIAEERAALIAWYQDYIGLNLTPAESAARTVALLEEWHA